MGRLDKAQPSPISTKLNTGCCPAGWRKAKPALHHRLHLYAVVVEHAHAWAVKIRLVTMRWRPNIGLLINVAGNRERSMLVGSGLAICSA